LVAVLLELPDPAVGEVFEGVVEIALPPTSFAMCAEMKWQDELSAMQSARYVAAVVLHDRRCWIEQFNAARRADPALTEFATNRVSVVRDDSLPPTGVSVRMTTGAHVKTVRRDRSPGEPDEPLARQQVYAKLDTACASTAIAAADRLEDVVLGLEERPAAAVCADLRAVAKAGSAETMGGSGCEFANQC
jgi:2-methylcitrate dehydratase PrpD